MIKRDGDWWTGRIGDRVGTFPNNYVQKIEHTPEVAIATSSYQGTEDNHLSFEQGQTIYIIDKDENGLLQGEIRVYSFFCHVMANRLIFFFFDSFLIKQYVLVGFRLIAYKYKQSMHQHRHKSLHQVNDFLKR